MTDTTTPACRYGAAHRFEARFDEEPMMKTFSASPLWSAEKLRIALVALTRRTYVHDICVHCGHVIAREAQHSDRNLDNR